MDFVHLHVHTQYSLLDGAIRLKDLFETAKAYQMPAATITDHGNMYGALEFYELSKKYDIKPIVGCEAYIAPRSRHDRGRSAALERAQGQTSTAGPTETGGDEDRSFHLTLLAQNQTGYRNLMKLVSLGFLEGFYYKPRIDKEILRLHSEGLIGLSGCLKGEVPSMLIRNQYESAKKLALEYARIFEPGNFYLEIQANGIPEQTVANEGLVRLAREVSLPLVATNDCHYLRKSDSRAHEILLCIQTGKTVSDEKRFKFHTDQLYFKSPEEMAKEFAHVPDALQNTVEIASRCNLKLDLGSYHFPVFPIEEGETIDERFEKEVREGFDLRIEAIKRKDPSIDEERLGEYRERVDYEIRVIKQMGFPAYFLIVSDFINYAKRNGIPVGPGRGSAAGSLVAYAMRITDLDPIEHGLIFERFLNIERISMPDIDVDFCVNGRAKVLEYVTNRYGKDRVSQIATFGTMQARAVIRDVGRALAMPYNEVDRIAKLIPATLGIDLKGAMAVEPRLVEMQSENPQLKELFEIARALEGLTRHASTHAAGVVIADRPIVEYMPMCVGPEGEIVSQYPMKYVEKTGLIKFDFLGLRNLTVINDAVKMIEENHGVKVRMEDLPLDDPATYALLARADTTGVFQLESSGMRDILVKLRPETFSDIVALVALYRPGPLGSGMVDQFIQGKHGGEIVYDLDILKPILEETHGVILYQEQVMKIASTLANYTLGEADILRKAMGKKIGSIMDAQKDRFVKGAVSNGIDPSKANHIFDLMAKFAEYGFNKSHSAAYALIAYHTAWLKANYPVEFMAALMNSFIGNSDQIVKLISQCAQMEIRILPPDVNESGMAFQVVERMIRFGLGAVKNVGETAVEIILQCRREQGPYTAIHDFCARIDSQKVNRRVIEQLIRCGAFDSLHPNRAQLMAGLDEVLDRAATVQKDRMSGQMNLFEVLRSKNKLAPPALPAIADWDSRMRLQFEKESLGFYISGHPLDFYSEQIRSVSTADTQSVKERREGAEVVLCGVFSIIKEITTKRGDRMAFLNLEDKEGTIEVVAFAEPFTQARELIAGDEPLALWAKVQHDEKSTKLIANRLMSMEEAALQAVDSVRIKLDATRMDRDAFGRLRHLLISHHGDCRAVLHLAVQDKGEAVLALSKLPVNPTHAFFEEMRLYFGPDCAEAMYRNGVH
ncbi:MAG: DNA polymerase III subunit alpha [Syntrophobacteraceae bacterium]|nr:DNA polymerase III subunit alpha [Syntrophobacteraceae bacterium]